MDSDLPVEAEGEDVPRAVVRAEEEIRRLGLLLGGTGLVASALYWVLAFQISLHFLFPVGWWALFMLGLLLYFFFPQTREARRAREILRRWDEAEVRGLLESSGSTSDPRLQAAQNMRARIVRHPATTDSTRTVVERLVDRLGQTTRDQRVVEIAMQAEGRSALEPAPRSLSDVIDHLESRAGRLLSALAELHGAVIDRDTDEVARVLTQASDVLVEMEAAQEVERLLQPAPTRAEKPEDPS